MEKKNGETNHLREETRVMERLNNVVAHQACNVMVLLSMI